MRDEGRHPHGLRPVETTDDRTRATILNKVPQLTLAFWLIKIMATTVGETAADLLSTTLKLGTIVTSWVMAALLIVALVFQFRAKRYVPPVYWLVVVFISVVGTLISDNLVDGMGISLVTTTVIFSISLIIVFIAWYASERTLSVHTIVTTKRELFYWAAILFTFSLGTSAGDLISERLGQGYLVAGLLFAAGIAVVYAAYKFFHLNAVLTFWIAYILTRPLGASMGDLLTASRKDGGLNLGTIPVSAVFLVVIVLLVVHLTRKERPAAPART